MDNRNNICSFGFKHIENKMIEIKAGEGKVGKREDRIFNRKITVLGMARSGMAVAKLLSKKGAEVFLSELRPQEELEKQIAQLKELYIDFETGAHTHRVFENPAIIFS